jgi:hypothetical protein
MYFDNPEILTNPEEYFGPNYKILLNLWIYWETLTSKQIRERFNNAFLNCNDELFSGNLDIRFSGSTCVTVLTLG